ncbi:MAG: mechanosensitive ion channel [Pseudomonadota bacterium]
MAGFMDQINSFFGGAIPPGLTNALVGLAILVVGLIVVRFLVGIFRRLLNSASFLTRTNADGSTTSFVPPILSLVRAILTIFVLMAVLQHFGLTDVLAPLQDLANKFLAAIPNIIGAGVIGYAGWVLAKIVSEIVGLGLSKVDEQIAERTGNAEIKVSGFGSAFIFGGVLLPIVVAALGVLNIPAISEPASAMIQKLMAAVPNIVGAGIILLVAYFVAKFVVYMLNGLLTGMNVDAMPEKIGAEALFSDSFTPTKLIGGSVMFFSMLTASTAAVETLGIDIISNIFGRMLEFGGGILMGAIILLIGNFLSNLAHRKLSESGSSGFANIARFAIIGLVVAMGLKAMGLADNIVNMAFGLTLGSVAVAAALAFGLGGRDAAKTVADAWASRMR